MHRLNEVGPTDWCIALRYAPYNVSAGAEPANRKLFQLDERRLIGVFQRARIQISGGNPAQKITKLLRLAFDQEGNHRRRLGIVGWLPIAQLAAASSAAMT